MSLDKPAEGVTRRLVGAVGLSLLVAALAWALPIIENARESPGNLTALARFFGEGLAEPRGTREAFRAMARVAAAVPLAIGEAIAPIPKGVAPRLASVLVVVEIGLVALAGWLAARRARPFAGSLCLVTLVGFAMATLSARQIAGPVHAYVLIWVTVLGVLGWTAIGCALVPLLPRVAPRRVGPLLAVGLLLLATAANVARIAGAPRIMPIAVEDARAVAQLHAAVRGYARDQGIARPLFDMEPLKRWGIVAGVLAELYEEGLPFAVRDRWLFMFGQPLRATGTEDSRIVFSTAEGPLPPHRVITRLEEILVYEVCGGPPARDRECRPPSPG